MAGLTGVGGVAGGNGGVDSATSAGEERKLSPANIALLNMLIDNETLFDSAFNQNERDIIVTAFARQDASFGDTDLYTKVVRVLTENEEQGTVRNLAFASPVSLPTAGEGGKSVESFDRYTADHYRAYVATHPAMRWLLERPATTWPITQQLIEGVKRRFSKDADLTHLLGGAYAGAYARNGQAFFDKFLARQDPFDMRMGAEFASHVLDHAMQVTGATQSIATRYARTTAGRYQQYQPALITLSLFTKEGVMVDSKKGQQGRIPLTADMTVAYLKEGANRKGGNYTFKPSFEKLLGFYSDTTTLGEIIADLHRIEVGGQTENMQGWDVSVEAFNGKDVKGTAAVDYLERVSNPEGRISTLVEPAFVKEAARVHDMASSTPTGRFVIPAQNGEGKPRDLLVGTGIAGENFNTLAKNFVSAGGDVFMPDIRMEGSRLSAALIAKTLAFERYGNVADTSRQLHLDTGRIFVGQVDGNDPGATANLTERLIDAVIPGGKAVMALGMYFDKRATQLEISQHALAVELAKAGKIRGVIRALSPTIAKPIYDNKGNFVRYRSDIVNFQGDNYQEANGPVKTYSDLVLALLHGLTVVELQGPVSETTNLRGMQKFFNYGPQIGVQTTSPQSFGDLLTLQTFGVLYGSDATGGRLVSLRADGGVAGDPAIDTAFNWRLVRDAAIPQMRGIKPTGEKTGPKYDSVRVTGPIVDMIRSREFTDISNVPDQFLAKAADPSNVDFKNFTFKTSDGTTNYVFWVNEPATQLPPEIWSLLEGNWHNALGQMFIVNPERDTYIVADHHSLAKNSWSEYNTDMPVGQLAWHALGGNMAFPDYKLDAGEQAHLLGAWGLSADTDTATLSADKQAALTMAGALFAVRDKAKGMATKYQLISEALEEIGLASAGLGGAKSITISPHDEQSRIIAMEMLEIVAYKTGAYISGPDQNTGYDKFKTGKVFMPDFAATDRSNGFHMAGATTAHEKVRGMGDQTSRMTAEGVYSGISAYIDTVVPLRKVDGNLARNAGTGLFIEGVGGVGVELVKQSLREKRTISALYDINLDGLLAAQKIAIEGGQNPLVILNVSSFDAEKAAQVRARVREINNPNIILVNNLSEALVKAGKLRQGEVGIYSPNGSSHPITAEVAQALADAGFHGALGAANNVLALDEKGTYNTVAGILMRHGIYVAHDSAINMMGAATVIAKAVGLTEEKRQLLNAIVGRRVVEDYIHGFKNGMAPQIYRDNLAMTRHNAQNDAGEMVGGKFIIADAGTGGVTPPIQGDDCTEETARTEGVKVDVTDAPVAPRVAIQPVAVSAAPVVSEPLVAELEEPAAEVVAVDPTEAPDVADTHVRPAGGGAGRGETNITSIGEYLMHDPAKAFMGAAGLGSMIAFPGVGAMPGMGAMNTFVN